MTSKRNIDDRINDLEDDEDTVDVTKIELTDEEREQALEAARSLT